MLLLPSTAWADYTYGSGEELSFDYDGNKRYFWSSNGTIWKASLSGDNPSWPDVTDYNTTPVTVSPFTNFDALKLTLQSKLKGTLTGFALSGTVTSEAHVNIKVYRLTAKDATTGTEIGSIAITDGATPTYTYTATTTNGVTQEFNNEYIQLAFEHTGGDASSIAYDAITGITLTFSGTSYDLSVGDCRVTSNNATDILGDSKVSFSSNTLTLSEGASLTNITYSGSEDLTIAFSGTVTINGEQSGSACIKATKPSKLIFTSSGGSLVLQGNGEYGVIQNFSDVNFGNLNLASSQSPGLYYNWNNIGRCGTMTGYSGNSVTNMTITTESVYPIWVMSQTPQYTQLTSESPQVNMVKKIEGTNVTICTVSYVATDATKGKLTIEANGEAGDNAFQPGGSNAAIVVGSSMEELTVHLVGDTKITDEGSYIFSAWNTTPLTFTTTESTPGSLTGTAIVNWKSKNNGGTGQISCENGLVYNAETNPQTISTTGVRLKIGDTEVSVPEDITIDGVSFYNTTNTLTLTDATIGSATSSSDIQVFVDDLKVVISGTCTINGRIVYSGSNLQTSSVQISNTDAASLTVAGISGFGNCSMSDGLYLSAVNGAGIPTDIHYEPYKTEEGEAGCMRSDYGEFSTITFSTTKPSESIWIGNTQVGGDGSFSGIEGVSFESENNINILTLNNANLPSNIISSLPNLTINLTGEDGQNKGQSNLSANSHIISTNPSATLTFTTDGDNSLWETIDNFAIPWKGFAGNPTFENKLVFLQAAGTMSIQVLHAPTMSYSSGSSGGLTFGGLSDGYNNTFDCYYTITYEDGDGSITNPTKYERGEVENQPNPVSMAEKPCTVTAYVTYKDRLDNTTQSETAIGKYFGIADKTIVFNNETKGSELKIDNLEIIPATKDEGVSFTFRGVDNSDVINPSLEGSGYKLSIAGIGRCEVSMEIDDDNATIQVLNPFEGPVSEVKYAKGVVTVLPDKPSIEKVSEHDYLNTDKITITRTSVEGEDADDYKIFYTWSDDVKVETYQQYVEGGSVSIYDPDEKIPAQTGKLWAWVGYHEGDGMYYTSDVVSEAFTVKTDISDYTVQGLATSATYTGAAIEPAFSVKASADAETSLTLNTDYTVSYQSVIIAAGDVGSGPSINYTDVDEMVEVGAYRIVITGTGDNYGGTTYADFAIDKADLDIVTIEAIADQTYTGSEITPEITVKLNGNTLSASDYGFSIGYRNNINVATSTSANAPTVTITATEGSNYFTAGTTKVANFNIVQKSLTDESISVTLSASSFTYNGDIQYPKITVKDGETTLTDEAYGYSYSQDGTAVDGPATAGTYTLTIYGKGNYTGEITKEITITPKEIATADITVTLATTSYTFDGTEHKPEVSSVTISDVTDPIEYENIVYTNNVNAALATATENAPTVTVSLKGNYSGTGVATFTIEQSDLSDYVVTGLTTPTAYTGSPITPTFSVKATETAETSLTANTDYSVKYQQAGADVDEMKDAGDYKIIITGEGNYKGSLDADFTIDRAQLNLTINLEGWAYGDTPNEPSLEGNLGEGDITWEYKAAGAEAYSAWSTLTTTTDAGTYMVKATVAETDNYEGGSKEAEFVIEQLDISQADITLDNNELTYNGEQQTVNVTKVMAGNIEVPIDCYEVSGNTEKEAGDYKLTVTAKTMDSSGNPIKNNFTGSAEKGWKIKNRTVTTDELGLSENQSQATYYSETEDLEVPEGVVAYIITGVNGNNVVTQRIRYIKKGVAVFVEQTTSTENPLEVIPDASELPLKGTAVDLNVASISGGTVYVLYKGEFVKSTTGTIPAKRCYLLLPNNVAAGTRAFGIIGGGSDGSTAIKSINDEPSTIDNWYDMGGHRIEKPTKTGIYIKNGKKVAIK